MPFSGMGYIYIYSSFGELPAWMVGWNMNMRMGMYAAAYSLAWSSYVVGFAELLGFQVPTFIYSYEVFGLVRSNVRNECIESVDDVDNVFGGLHDDIEPGVHGVAVVHLVVHDGQDVLFGVPDRGVLLLLRHRQLQATHEQQRRLRRDPGRHARLLHLPRLRNDALHQRGIRQPQSRRPQSRNPPSRLRLSPLRHCRLRHQRRRPT